MEPIACIHTDFPTKFGLPRQSGLVEALEGRVVFQPAYSNPVAFRGLEQFSHIWLIWDFSAAKPRSGWSPTVRPPRLGRNQRMGVFATRSPFRPNSLGLSCVRLRQVCFEDGRAVLYVSGIDMMDGTPIYDVKPYIPLTDCRQDATQGYTRQTAAHQLEVVFPPALLEQLPEEKRTAAVGILQQDPRPGYSEDPARIYGLAFAGFDLQFTVDGNRLTVCSVNKLNEPMEENR